MPSREVTTSAAFPFSLGLNLARLELHSKTQHGDCGHWAGMRDRRRRVHLRLPARHRRADRDT